MTFDCLEERRVLTAGLLDPTFGTGGIASESFPYSQPSQDTYPLVATQPDGKFIVATQTNAPDGTYQSEPPYALTRYDADGSVDTSFGTAGTVYVPASQQSVNTMTVAPQGQLIVVGAVSSSSPGIQNLAVSWYSAAGVFERTVTTQIQAWGDAVAVEPNGQVVIAGPSDAATSNLFGDDGPIQVDVARYNPDGSLDTSFGTGGNTTLSPGIVSVAAMAIEPSGQIVLGGSTGEGNYPPINIIADTIGANITLTNAGNPQVSDAETQPSAASGPSSDFSLTMLNADGTLDTNFGNGGTVTTAIEAWAQLTSLAIQPNGEIVAGGPTDTAGFVGPSNPDQFALARYNTDGTLDATFGTGGIVTTAISGSSDSVSAIEIESTGDIVAIGTTTDTDFYTSSVIMACYDPDGSLNTSFGQAGIAQVNSLGEYGFSFSSNSVAELANGDILIVDTAFVGTLASGASVLEFTASGAADTTFNGTGSEVVHVATFSEPGNATGDCEVVQPDGKIVAAGVAQGPDGTPPQLALTRFNTDGSLDTTFGSGGSVTSFWQGGFTPNALALEPNGQIVAVGAIQGTYPDATFAVARYNADGSVDTSFGNQGLVVMSFNAGYDAATGVAIAADGKIVVSGVAAPTANANAYVTASIPVVVPPERRWQSRYDLQRHRHPFRYLRLPGRSVPTTQSAGSDSIGWQDRGRRRQSGPLQCRRLARHDVRRRRFRGLGEHVDPRVDLSAGDRNRRQDPGRRHRLYRQL